MVIEERIIFANCDMDQYEAEVKFGENSTFEVGSVLMEGKKSTFTLNFPFSRCYRITERELATSLYQVPRIPQKGTEYPIYKIQNSLFIKEVVQVAGGILESEELEHYQVLSTNLVIDVILHTGEQVSIQKGGETGGRLG